MASALGIDMGNVYRTTEAVKASRAARNATETQQQNAMAQQGALQAASANAIANPGDPTAMAAVAVLDAATAKSLTDIFAAAEESEKQKLVEQNEQIGQLAAGILDAEDPAAAYASVYANLPPDMKGKFSPQYDPNRLKMYLAQATAVDKLYESLNAKATATTERTNALADSDVEHQRAIELENIKSDNNIRENVAKTEAELAAEEAAGGTAVLESADANALNKYALQLLGGTFDQAGNLQTLDPNLRSRAQAIATRAEQLMTGPEKMGHNAATQRAAQEMGITFETPGAAPAPGPALGVPAPAASPAIQPGGVIDFTTYFGAQ